MMIVLFTTIVLFAMLLAYVATEFAIAEHVD